MCEGYKTDVHGEQFKDVNTGESTITMPLQGPMPKCYILSCDGDRHRGVSALTVSTIVDLIEVSLKPNPQYDNLTNEINCTKLSLFVLTYILPTSYILIQEWSRNERNIGNYELNYFSKPLTYVAAEFKDELLARDLQIRLEVVKENAEFVIRKLTRRDDGQVSSNTASLL